MHVCVCVYICMYVYIYIYIYIHICIHMCIYIHVRSYHIIPYCIILYHAGPRKDGTGRRWWSSCQPCRVAARASAKDYTILYHNILYYTILYYTIPYYTILYYTTLHYTIPYHNIPYYNTLCILSHITSLPRPCPHISDIVSYSISHILRYPIP